ncbi:MAG: hypothetical protein K8R23_02515 [Chthoniobacter sp.]|nr:hypothetical protein [Chthoniobacter sp.]
MKDVAPLPPEVAPRGRWVGRGLLLLALAACGWSGWREYDYRAAVREARAAGFVIMDPTALGVIRADWHAVLRLATWSAHERQLFLGEGADLAPLRPLLLRLDPTHLWAPRCRHLDGLHGLTRLRMLDLAGSDVKDLVPLAGFARLEQLYLSGCPGVADLAPLAGLAQMRRLDLRRCTGLANLAPLAGLTQLQTLELTGCTGVADLATLAGLAQLRELDLRDCTRITDLAPLAGLAQLQWLSLGGCTGLSAEAVAAFKKSHPQVMVVGPIGQRVRAD